MAGIGRVLGGARDLGSEVASTLIGVVRNHKHSCRRCVCAYVYIHILV